MKLKFYQLRAGTILLNQKNGNIFEVIRPLPEEFKFEMKNLKTGEVIKVSERTYRSFWQSAVKLDSENI